MAYGVAGWRVSYGPWYQDFDCTGLRGLGVPSASEALGGVRSL